MLGKRFRRTTSMTQLGPPLPLTVQEENTPAASNAMVPYKAAKSVAAHEEDPMATDHDPLSGAVIMAHQPVHAGTMAFQGTVTTHMNIPSPPLYAVPYQMGLWTGHHDSTVAHVTKTDMMSISSHGKLHEQYTGVTVSPVGFLEACFFCKRRLRHERDIFIYRGDSAFCSEECRHRQILSDERRSSGASNQRKDSTNASETAVAA